MAAPPPPPPPPPPGPINAGKPDNKKLLDSICKGTSLKKVPDSMKNDRSEALLSKPPGAGNSKNNSGPLVPPSNKPMTLAEELAARRNPKASVTPTKSQKATVTQIAPQVPPIPPSNKPMSLNEELAARKNQKSNDFQSTSQSSPNMSNPKRGGAPLPNSLPPPVAPPPPSAVNKPPSIAQQTAPIKIPPPPTINSSQPPPPPPNFISAQPPPPPPNFISAQPPPPPPNFISAQPPPPPPKDSKPNFRQPIPICSKPTINGDSQIRGIQPNQFCSPIIPPPPPPMFPSSNDVCPPRFGPPPPPPPMSFPKPNAPIREDYSFDSRFTFMEMKYFPDPNKMSKIRQT